ncbi:MULTISPECIES: ABC transporter substrate-binding protein [unclassified Streptomyces]|uniref:ABC transporter substrate-binding protein n=1 Tax=unclassified Streptomyces TaxID=2593676 RepID=UPI000963FA5F|nr:ABC transporter substrate-binding protein [Streptomyces sp. TSRI0107]OKJ72753.1 hypothetical protein AMK31_33905 [Streptomyces sp. TSRI0107]
MTAAGCGTGGEDLPGDSTGTLTIGIGAKPQSLNPGKNGNGGQNIVQWLAYEPLIRMNSDGSYSPGLATEWGYKGSGNTSFEMTIRTDAKFADGTAVTAKSVVDTLTYYLKNPGPLSHYMAGITSVRAKGDKTVSVSLSQPNPILPTVFSQVANWGDIISPAGLASPGKLSSQMFGAGAYTMDPAQTVDGDHYTFVKNEHYWNKAAVHYDKVVVKVLPDPNTALQTLRGSQIQVDMNATGALAQQARSAGARTIQGPGFNQTLFLVDRAGKTNKPLGDLKVRQALNHAVDRKAIAKALGGAYEASTQISPRGTDGYDKALNDRYPYDPAKAKRLLAEAGYPDGFSMNVLSTSLLDMDTVAQALAQQFAKIGVRADIKSVGTDLNKLISDMSSKRFPVVMFNTGTDMFTNALQNFASPVSPLNPFNSRGKEVTSAFDKLARAQESRQRSAAVELNKAVVDNAWFVPVADTPTYIFTKGITNVGTIGSAGAIDVLKWRPAS